jgi:hypothetical protein
MLDIIDVHAEMPHGVCESLDMRGSCRGSV